MDAVDSFRLTEYLHGRRPESGLGGLPDQLIRLIEPLLFPNTQATANFQAS